MMKLISVEIVDVTGAKRQRANIPDDIPIKRIITTLVSRMNLPTVTPEGEPLTYQLHYKDASKTLTEDGTLASHNVRPGSVLKIYPVVIAGT